MDTTPLRTALAAERAAVESLDEARADYAHGAGTSDSIEAAQAVLTATREATDRALDALANEIPADLVPKRPKRTYAPKLAEGAIHRSKGGALDGGELIALVSETYDIREDRALFAVMGESTASGSTAYGEATRTDADPRRASDFKEGFSGKWDTSELLTDLCNRRLIAPGAYDIVYSW